MKVRLYQYRERWLLGLVTASAMTTKVTQGEVSFLWREVVSSLNRGGGERAVFFCMYESWINHYCTAPKSLHIVRIVISKASLHYILPRLAIIYLQDLYYEKMKNKAVSHIYLNVWKGEADSSFTWYYVHIPHIYIVAPLYRDYRILKLGIPTYLPTYLLTS